ncbi:MAG: molybdopterin molybdotransferase MoeA [Thermaceae bacterium]|nr:molybdopterin molybdotransferase MoeA [Thermaceae bacterium]
MKQNISLEDALEVVLGKALALESSQETPLVSALGRTLGADLTAKVNHPDADDTSLDGYACLEADAHSAAVGNPVRLKVIGTSPAGNPFKGTLQHGEAVQVFTGTPVPKGADAVIRVEDTLREDEYVWLMRPASSADIRRKGDDLQQGSIYLHKGDLLTPGRIGLAAAMGYPSIPTVLRPKVGIISTGDEVVEPGEPLPYGGVYNSNSYSIAGLVLEAGGEPVMLGKVSDNIDGLRGQLLRAGKLDLLLTSGGVSMGEHDIVRQMLEREGQIHFWKVRVQPGGPFLFADWEGMTLMGLPGNPVSAMVIFLLFGRPFLFKLLSRTDPPFTVIKAVTDTPFSSNPTKQVYRRAVLGWKEGRYHVSSTGNQSSGVLRSMAVGNALVVLAAGKSVGAGDVVEVIPLS